MILPRQIQSTIEKSLKESPAVGLLGSRQVGKTTLAKEIQKKIKNQAIYIDLELPSDINKLQAPELYLKEYEDRLVIIDEIQRMPDLFPLLRALIDQKQKNGRFLILGSASPDLIKKSSESLAGRILYHELTPFTLEELTPRKINYQRLWLRGGYPRSLLSKNDELSFQWLESFIQTYLERDIPQLGIHIPSPHLRRFLTMCAHLHGQTWNASKIGGSLGISAPTAKHYLNILQNTFIIRQLQPYFTNIKKRLIKCPKIYFRDSGMLHTLLAIMNYENLMVHPVVGNSFEGFIIEQIINMLPFHWKYYFWRTSAGAEVDLVLLEEGKKPIVVEIKYSLSPTLTKGFWNALDDLKCSHAYIVYPGKEKYKIRENVIMLPIDQLSQIMDKIEVF